MVVGLSEKGALEPKADVVVSGDERAHQQEAQSEQIPEAWVAEMGANRREERRRPGRGRSSPLPRQREGERGRAAERNEADESEGVAPTAEFSNRRARQASAHAPERIARNIEAHGEPDRRTIHLFDQIGHGDGRHA